MQCIACTQTKGVKEYSLTNGSTIPLCPGHVGMTNQGESNSFTELKYLDLKEEFAALETLYKYYEAKSIYMSNEVTFHRCLTILMVIIMLMTLSQ